MVRIHVPQHFVASAPQCLRPHIKATKLLNAVKRYLMYYVYVVECADKSLYVGCTNDLEKRLKQHNESKWGAHYTKIRRPVRSKYSETFDNLKDARRREAEIKGWRREKKLNLAQEGTKSPE
jgi:putative endonuclease